MKKLIIPFVLFMFCLPLYSQNIDSVLAAVEQNNTLLVALKQIAEAEKTGNKTGIYPDNPELEYHYLWGTPAMIGNRKDISVTQTFDFPTAYFYRNDLADMANRQAELHYLQQRNNVMLETAFLLCDLIYLNALHAELTARMEHAQNLANAYSARLNAGDANILEYNKAQISLLNTSKELNTINIKQEAAVMELAGLNGGNYIPFKRAYFSEAAVPDHFDTWFEAASLNNPALAWLDLEIEKNELQIKLNKTLSLPKFTTGYMSEKVAGEQFQGIAAGVTIPLWENKNRIKHAKALADATQSQAQNETLRFYNHLKTLHLKAVKLQQNVMDYRKQLSGLEHSSLLKKALDAGEITLIDYMLELSVFYESVDRMLELENELHKTVAELNLYN